MPGRNGKGPSWWHAKFKGCGYRITVCRETILDVLSKSEKHLSAEDVYSKVIVACPGVSLTSVYRTMDVLTDLGLIFKFDFGDGKARYELSEGPKGKYHHHHLVCTRCKRIVDYTDFIEDELELLKRSEKGLSEKYRFQINSHVIQFYGLCESCVGKK